jgi:steroid 5-alpha reductase family enzyme
MSDWLSLLTGGAAITSVLMTALWWWHLRIGNAGVVDVGWAAALPLLAVFYAAMGPGYGPRRWVLAAMVCVWGMRLAIYLLRGRVIGQPEDPRYAHLRRTSSPAAALRFLPFFLAQGLLAVLLSLPALVAAFDQEARFRVLEIVAVVLWGMAVSGEALADAQLARFKKRPDTGGRTCREGLWRYSRHPNYFFEWLVWVAFAVYALGSPWGAAALVCPALMLYLLFRVTGIPATEAQALRSRGDDYRRYQATTSAFVPWFPREA